MNITSWYNGIGISKKAQNYLDDLVNVDIHSETGSIKPQLALAKESGTTVTEGCYSAVAPNGDVYFFSKDSGKTWKRAKSDGAYSLVNTNSNGAHKGCVYYRGYMYYATDTKLGRYNLDATWNDNFQVLTSGTHAMRAFDLILYLANDNDVAQFDDADVFSESGLDLPTEQDIADLKAFGDDLLVLANPGDYINDSKVFRWNTYADSWDVADPIKAIKPYAFIDADNYTYVVCQGGEIYLYTGTTLESFSKIRNADTTTGHQLTCNFAGKPLIANGGKIYSLHRANRNLPMALCCEYTCSAGVSASINSLAVSGNELLVSWTYNSTYGIDKISSNYANAEIVTPVFREGKNIKVFYDSLPEGTSIAISIKKDGETSWTSKTVEVDDADEMTVRLASDLDFKSYAQAKIVLNSDGTDCPIVDNINIE
jgi:hypothetical protein